MKVHYLLCLAVAVGLGRVGLASAASTAVSFAYAGPEHADHLAESNYLVIGVFAYQDNAQSFSDYAQSQGLTARYGYHPSRGYYYVYTFSSDSAAQVVEACWQVRSSSEFTNAWVFRAYEAGNDGDNGWGDPEVNTPSGNIERVDSIQALAQQDINGDLSAPTINQLPPAKGTEPGHQVYFRTLGVGQAPVSAVVKVVDGVRAKSIKQCDAHRAEVLEYDRLLSDQVQLITYAIGYRKASFDLSLEQPVNDSTASYVAMNGDTINVTMPLEKLKKGDVQAMFNTYFYGNSSVMRERSRYELEELQKFMHDSPEVKIMLHGHTNGNSRGVVYTFSEDHGNFFNLRRSNEYKKNGVSSMKLSKLRAETIRQYLIKQNITEDRIEVKGWGGKKMLYDADSPLAKNNIRVEIEVLED